MQRNRTTMDSCPETIDLNQGSVSSNSSVDGTVTWDNLLNPVEDRLSNSMHSSARESSGFVNSVNCDSQNSSAWDQGGSSYSANSHGHGHCSDLKIGHSWPSSSSDYSLTNPKSEERRFEPCNVFIPERSATGYGGNGFIGSRPSLPNLPSDQSTVNANLSGVYNHGDTRLVMGPSVSPTTYTSTSRLEAERPASGVSYSVGTSSGSSSHWAGTPDISGSSMGNWGLSCKRKALEGSSAQSCGGSSSSNSNAEPENIIQHNFPSRHNVSSSLNMSPASATMQNPGYLESRYPINGVGTSVAAFDIYPPLSDSGVAETSARNFGVGVTLGNQDTFGLPPTGNNLAHSNVSSTLVPSRPISVTSSLSSGQPISLPMSSGNPGSHSGIMPISGVPRGLHPVPWNASPNSRGGSSSSPNIVSDRYAALLDEANFRSSTRNNREPRPFVPTPETRHMVQDPTNWSLATSDVSYSINTPSSSAVGRGSRVQTSPNPWMPNQNSASSSNRSFSEFAPWTLLPPVESESSSQRAHFSVMPSAASSVEEAEMSSRSSSRGSSSRGSSSRRNHQLHLRSALMADFPDTDMDGWRGLAADIEGRHRLIRQVLHAMRRVENVQSEDYMLLDPFVNGVAELHDRHRDMRLDVDNMSYEELLALEERIGNVNTGLSEEAIMSRMKQRKHEPMYAGASSSNLEPCCICREEYTIGEDMGMLDCGHEFHSSCIKQWLVLKNLCPICKMTALQP